MRRGVVCHLRALFGGAVACALLACAAGDEAPAPSARPNVVLIVADDLGYADLGSYGATAGVRTPRLDELAAEGVRFTQAYSAASVCTPARAALLTGRQGPRLRLPGRVDGVYFPASPGGLDPQESTLAERLQEAGYATALAGKWHLGDRRDALPLSHGFDAFFGIPYSNDMTPLPLVEDETTVEILESPAPGQTRMGPDTRQAGLAGRVTDWARRFMADSHASGQPFFLMYASHLPHVPLAPSAAFVGTAPACDAVGARAACGVYGDVVAELDATVGALLDELERLAIGDDTIVIFFSDNGGWLSRGQDGGSNGGLREGKTTTFEGGFRIPMIARFRSQYRAGVVEDAPATTMDWYPTLLAELGLRPSSAPLDGESLAQLLRGQGPRGSGEPFRFLYYRADGRTPGAYRDGRWKYKAATEVSEDSWRPLTHGELLFDLDRDPGEQVDLSASEPERLSALRDAMEAAHAERMSDGARMR